MPRDHGAFDTIAFVDFLMFAAGALAYGIFGFWIRGRVSRATLRFYGAVGFAVASGWAAFALVIVGWIRGRRGMNTLGEMILALISASRSSSEVSSVA